MNADAFRSLSVKILRIVALLMAFSGAASLAQSGAASASLIIDAGVHLAPVRRIAVDTAGEVAITASDDKTAIVWNLATMKPSRVLRVPVATGEVGRLYGVAKEPSGPLVAVAGTTGTPSNPGSHKIYVFDSLTGAFVRAFDARGGDIKRLAWSADGRYIAAVYAGDPAVRVFGSDGQLWFEQKLPADAYGLSLASEGRMVVASFDRKLRLYRVRGPQQVQLEGEINTTLKDPVTVRHSPDGRLLAVGYFSLNDELGTQGTVRRRQTVDVYIAANRELERSLHFSDLSQGNLMTVAWQADGRGLFVGGTGHSRPGEYPIKRISWPEAEVTSFVAATDSILDMAALPDGRLAFASFDGTMGIANATAVLARSDSRTNRITDAADLRLSADARTVQWRAAGDTTGPRSFDLAQRLLAGAAPGVTAAIETDRAALPVLGIVNRGAAPSVNGHALLMLPNEFARASMVMPDRQSAIIGLTRTLRRVDRSGQELWRLALHSEARAVHASADGRLAMAALSDGSIRWYRASDGVLLLSMLVLRDGRWVLWTESGHFDAAPGAEDLVGWLVTRPGGEQADYHGASRLRDRFLRPDIIDQVLVQQDLPRAIAAANAARLQLAQSIPQEDDLVARVQAQQQPVVVVQALPGSVTLAKAPPPEVDSTTLELEVKVYAQIQAMEQSLKARVDGRPVELLVKRLEPLPNGEVLAQVSVQLVHAAGRLQIAAEGRNGMSMPVELNFRSTAAALRERPRPSLYLVSIGVSRYANPAINLVQASKDARDFARSLETQQGHLYEGVHSRVLVDDKATRAGVLDALKWLRQSVGANDTAVLFVAGHGVVDAADTYYFLPHDMNETRLRATAVSDAQLRDALAAIKGRTLFFVDTCFASRAINPLNRGETTRLASGMAQSELGVIVFSGSAARQESLESTEWGNGAFTKALVEGLSGLADARRGGFVTHVGLDFYVGQAVRALTGGRQTPMTAVPQGIADYPVAKVTTIKEVTPK